MKYLLITAALFILTQSNSRGGGFPVRPGSLTVSASVSYFFANKGWDSTSKKSPFALNGQFSSLTYSVNAEYGISRRFTFVALLPYSMNTYNQSNFSSRNNGLTDLETGIRYYVANINLTYYFTIQGTFITPMYTNPNLGYAENGAEIKASFAGSGRVLGRNYYFILENGVRQYFGTTGPGQDRYNATFGLTLDRKFKQQISVSFGGFYSTSSFTKFSVNQATNKNFAFNQASISYGYSFSKRFSLFVTGGTFLSGRNTGDGSSASMAVIVRPFAGI